jgi:SAM-dependent methyltransferase
MECGLVFQNPFPSEEFLNTFYGKDFYRGLYWGTHRAPKEDLEKRVRTAEERADLLLKLVSNTSTLRILDYGSGVGVFRDAVQARRRDAEVLLFDPGTGEKRTLDTQRLYDIVTLFHVLEHLYNPKKVLEDIHALLRPGGFICIELPELSLLKEKHDFHIAHVLYFGKSTLARLLENIGYTILEVHEIPSRRALFLVASITSGKKEVS